MEAVFLKGAFSSNVSNFLAEVASFLSEKFVSLLSCECINVDIIIDVEFLVVSVIIKEVINIHRFSVIDIILVRLVMTIPVGVVCWSLFSSIGFPGTS